MSMVWWGIVSYGYIKTMISVWNNDRYMFEKHTKRFWNLKPADSDTERSEDDSLDDDAEKRMNGNERFRS